MIESDDRLSGKTHNVFGIREFKGLEETHICVYGFFGAISDEDVKKGWQRVLAKPSASVEGERAASTEPLTLKMESELKLFYNAVTRCKIKLVFIEPEVNPEKLPATLAAFLIWFEANHRNMFRTAVLPRRA